MLTMDNKTLSCLRWIGVTVAICVIVCVYFMVRCDMIEHTKKLQLEMVKALESGDIKVAMSRIDMILGMNHISDTERERLVLLHVLCSKVVSGEIFRGIVMGMTNVEFKLYTKTGRVPDRYGIPNPYLDITLSLQLLDRIEEAKRIRSKYGRKHGRK